MKFLLTIKHWVLFLIIMIPTLAPNFISKLFHPKYAFFSAFIIYMLVILGWFYSIGTSANSKLPIELRKTTTLLKFSLIFAVLYCLYISQLFLSNNFISPNQEPPSWLIPAHLFSMFGIFYSMWFAAKQFTSYKENRKVKFIEYAGRFFLLWFFPIGIWFLQPEINQHLGKDV